jgi:hypothetical protein
MNLLGDNLARMGSELQQVGSLAHPVRDRAIQNPCATRFSAIGATGGVAHWLL